MEGLTLICVRCGRHWPICWQDQPGWPCRNTVIIDAADRLHGRPCMGLLTYPGVVPVDQT